MRHIYQAIYSCSSTDDDRTVNHVYALRMKSQTYLVKFKASIKPFDIYFTI